MHWIGDCNARAASFNIGSCIISSGAHMLAGCSMFVCCNICFASVHSWLAMHHVLRDNQQSMPQRLWLAYQHEAVLADAKLQKFVAGNSNNFDSYTPGHTQLLWQLHT